jgi:hypothetical protein
VSCALCETYFSGAVEGGVGRPMGRIVECQTLKDTRAWIAHANDDWLRERVHAPTLRKAEEWAATPPQQEGLGMEAWLACLSRTRSCILSFQAFGNPQCSGKLQLFEIGHSISSRSRSKASDGYPLRSTGCGTAANCRASFDYVRAASQMSNESAHIVV